MHMNYLPMWIPASVVTIQHQIPIVSDVEAPELGDLHANIPSSTGSGRADSGLPASAIATVAPACRNGKFDPANRRGQYPLSLVVFNSFGAIYA